MRKKIKVFFTAVLVLSMVLAFGAFALANDYSSHWSAQFIDNASSRGWMNGDGNGNFRPESAITRGEFAVMLWRALGQTEPKFNCPFKDVPASAFYHQAVTALFEANVVTGMSSDTYGPDITLTREMGCTMLARAYNLNPSNQNSYQRFADAAEVSEWARPAISALVERDYVAGVGDNKIAPRQQLKRGEMAKLLTTVYDGVNTAIQQSNQSLLTAYTSGPNISVKQIQLGSDEVKVTVTATDNRSVDYIGWREAERDAVYRNNSGFTNITSNKEFSVKSNGWYAIYAENKDGFGSFRLFEVTTIEESAPKVTLSQRTDSVTKDVIITISVSSSRTVDFVGWCKSREGETYNNDKNFSNNGITKSGNTYTYRITNPERDYGWYAFCAKDDRNNLGYRLIEVNKGGATATYTVTFNANGGTGAPDAQTVASGGRATLPSKEPTRTDFEFAGWHIHQTNITPYSFSNTVTRNITLYAHWTAKGSYMVIFWLNNGSGEAHTTQIVKSGEKLKRPDDPAKGDWKFTGWYDIGSSNPKQWNFDNDVVTNRLQLYAFWDLPPDIITNSQDLEDGTVGEPYEAELEIEGDSPIALSVSNGRLPNGLDIDKDKDGIYYISGTPTAAGTFTFTLKADNDVGSISKQLSITIVAPRAPNITTNSLPDGTVGTTYTQTLTAIGNATIRWSLDSGSLPAGLSLSNSGVISGTPTEDGDFTFTVKAANDQGSDTKELTIIINAAVVEPEPDRPVITTVSLPNGMVGVLYNQTLAAEGDVPITWSKDGSWPGWLNIDSTTGVIAGTPTEEGEFTFTVKANNLAGDVTKEFTITINPAE
ncbi:MAG: S-layer homology domain-containing protein [Clostridiales bacterium]|nr:S-layer homology domain-containing protein [Clostridiales bacterium]